VTPPAYIHPRQRAGPDFAGGSSVPGSRPPAIPPGLAQVVDRHPGVLAVRYENGNWRLAVSAGDALWGTLSAPDPLTLERFARAVDAWQRAEADRCTCGHSHAEHNIEPGRKTHPCGRIGCLCTNFTAKGGAGGPQLWPRVRGHLG
jgi:hypothetical protein